MGVVFVGEVPASDDCGGGREVEFFCSVVGLGGSVAGEDPRDAVCLFEQHGGELILAAVHDVVQVLQGDAEDSTRGMEPEISGRVFDGFLDGEKRQAAVDRHRCRRFFVDVGEAACGGAGPDVSHAVEGERKNERVRQPFDGEGFAVLDSIEAVASAYEDGAVAVLQHAHDDLGGKQMQAVGWIGVTFWQEKDAVGGA